MVLVVKNFPASAGDLTDVGLIPGSGRSPGGGHGNPLQYTCLENPMDRGAWWASVHRDAKSQTQLSQTQLSTHVSIKLSQAVLVLKNLPANAGDIRDVGLTTKIWCLPTVEELSN